MIILPTCYPVSIVKTNINSWQIVTYYRKGWQHGESAFRFDELKKVAKNRLILDIQVLERAIEFKKKNLRLLELLEENQSDSELARFVKDFQA